MSGENSLKTISRRGDHVGFWLRVLSNGVSRTFEKSLQNYDVTVAQWMVLRALYGRETSLIELSEAIGIDQGSTGEHRYSVPRCLNRSLRRELDRLEAYPTCVTISKLEKFAEDRSSLWDETE